MGATLNFEMRDAPPELWRSCRWIVLTQLMLHANVRNRCWPTVDYLADKLRKSTATVVAALKWLRAHEAIFVVKASERVGAEKKLPNRQHVYQLTGEFVFGEKRVLYLYIGKEHGQVEVSKSKTSDVQVSETKVSGFISSKTGNQTIYSKDSQLNQTPELGESGAAILKAVAEVTGCDPLLNPKEITELAQHLNATGYSWADVLDWHQRCWLTSWRKGSPPSLKEVRQFIGQVRALPPAQPESASTGTVEQDRYFAALEKHGVTQLSVEEFAEGYAATSFTKPYTGRWSDWWLATLGQFSIQLNKATYETWLSRLKLVDVVEREDGIVEFVAEVPDHYVKDWIEQNLMAAFERTLCDLCHFPYKPLRSGQIGLGVKITLEDVSA